MTSPQSLYHYSIGLPKGFISPTQRVNLKWTSHATRAAAEDRYGKIKTFKSVTLSRFKVIEVGMVGNSVSKILFRGRYDDLYDVCMVLIPSTRDLPWTVKTVWLNENTDTHVTLDETKYCIPN